MVPCDQRRKQSAESEGGGRAGFICAVVIYDLPILQTGKLRLVVWRQLRLWVLSRD